MISLLTLAAVLLLPAALSAEEIPTITAIMENGPSENRINIVFLSEAYVASQRETYFNDVAIATEGLFNFTPFKEYQNYFNVYAIWVASQDSFLANVARGEEPRTYFGQWGGLGADGEKARLVMRSFFPSPGPIVTIMLENDDRVTGVGGKDEGLVFIGGVVVGTGRLHHDPDITPVMYVGTVVHEFGHTLGLQDEYNGTLVLRPGETESNSSINVTTETNRNRIKWKHWIEPATPIPTPWSEVLEFSDNGIGRYTQISAYADKVGLFEGANSYTKGWYRPRLNCAMRGVRAWGEEQLPFCEVCREALVLEIYRQVDPTAFPDVTVGDESTTFSINNLPQPLDHNLKIQWLVDGQVMPEQNSTSLQISDSDVKPPRFNIVEIGYGRHTVTVQVVDTTEFVRKDSEGLLVRSVEWRPIVIYPKPDFSDDGKVDFDDFFMFADIFGQAKTKSREKFDLDWDGKIDFNDFFLFADAFGK